MVARPEAIVPINLRRESLVMVGRLEERGTLSVYQRGESLRQVGEKFGKHAEMCRNVSHVVLSHFGAQLCEDPNSVAFHLLLLSYQDEGGRRQGAWRFAAETKGLVGKKETSRSAGGVSWLAHVKALCGI